MLRKISLGQPRRSSQPKKLSLISEVDDKLGKANGEGKKSFIPRPKSARASSVEREDNRRSSAKLLTAPLRNRSQDRASSESCQKASDFRSRSTENLFTPKYATKSPAVSSSRQTATGSKSARKDNRPLHDRDYQNLELLKVHQYLVEQNILNESEVQEVRNPMTTKLFVTVINALFRKMLPTTDVNLSNYAEVIPPLMKHLKYPGIVSRSWLVTANSTHSWPHVLGLMSWITDILSLVPSNLEYVPDEMMIIDNDKVKKLQSYLSQRYINWCDDDDGCSPSNEEQFFEELLLDNKKELDEQLMNVQLEEERLQDLKKEIDNPEENAAEENLKLLKLEKEHKRTQCSSAREINNKLKNILETRRREKQSLKFAIKNLKQNLNEDVTTTICGMEDVTNMESEANSLRNINKLKDDRIAEIKNKCYSVDLAIARLQGKLEKVKLQRESLFQEISSEYIDKSKLKVSLNSGNDNSDYSEFVKEYTSYLEDMSKSLKCTINNCNEKEKNLKLTISESEESIKFYEEEIQRELAALEQFEFDFKEIKIATTALERKVHYGIENHNKNVERLVVLEENLDTLRNDVSCKEKKVIHGEEIKKELMEKCNRILSNMVKMLHDYTLKAGKYLEDSFK